MTFKLPSSIPADYLWDLAIWHVTQAELEARGYTFHADVDDLDSFRYAEIDDPEIGKILIMERDHPPLKLGFDVMIQANVTTDEGLDALRRQFGCKPSDLVWTTNFPHFPGLQGELLDPPLTEEQREANEREATEWFARMAAQQDARLRRPA